MPANSNASNPNLAGMWATKIVPAVAKYDNNWAIVRSGRGNIMVRSAFDMSNIAVLGVVVIQNTPNGWQMIRNFSDT